MQMQASAHNGDRRSLILSLLLYGRERSNHVCAHGIWVGASEFIALRIQKSNWIKSNLNHPGASPACNEHGCRFLEEGSVHGSYSGKNMGQEKVAHMPVKRMLASERFWPIGSNGVNLHVDINMTSR